MKKDWCDTAWGAALISTVGLILAVVLCFGAWLAFAAFWWFVALHPWVLLPVSIGFIVVWFTCSYFNNKE